ncbi:putative PDGF/VEGF domain-containing protein 1 [Homarus americanus]|uniref:Putative PDGF/VEGF domain-containing protein 1 n=1 Tax=Homarus americanus TaxID=6706 RepID=A0A8J5JRY0_HOMAM|nr:putative PDGF/VEGF domain-containing protein 1 [Homarus americanus]
MEAHVLCLLLVCLAVTVNSMTVTTQNTISNEINKLTATTDVNRIIIPADVNVKTTHLAGQRAITRQMKKLKKMKCKPYLKMMYVKDLMEETDERKDRLVVPEVVAVKRCDESCSYCGNNLGQVRAKCTATKKRNRMYTVRYLDDNDNWKYMKFPVMVDSKCQCR